MLIKKILFMILLFINTIATAGIVNNSSSLQTSEDSLSVVFCSLDSLGNMTTADSVYFVVSAPDGSLAYKDSISITDSRLTSLTVQTKQFYIFADEIAKIDGIGSDGVYHFCLLARNSNLNLETPNWYWFQIVQDELSDRLAIIDDSVLVKGGAIDSNRTESSSVDSTDIARSVWDTQQSGHINAGTFGSYLNTQVSGLGMGSGAYSVSFVLFDSVNAQVIPSASITVRNVSQSALIAVGRSDNNGQVAFNLDADSFVISATEIGYLFDAYDTTIISGASLDTLFAVPYSVDTPAGVGLTRVWGYLYDINARPQQGTTVRASLPGGVVRYKNVIVSPFTVSTITDTAGLFYLDLIPSDSLRPVGTMYEISISRSDGTVLRQRIKVPDASLWELSW